MAGVTGRKYADGTWRIWYMDGEGKQKFARGTRSKRESRQLAKTLETRERSLASMPQATPMTQDMPCGDPIEDIMADYIAWGDPRRSHRRLLVCGARCRKTGKAGLLEG